MSNNNSHPYRKFKDKNNEDPFDELPPVNSFNEEQNQENQVENKQPEENQTGLFPESEKPKQLSIRDQAIEAQLKNMQFPTQVLVRPSYDYRKQYHILNVLSAEFIEIVKYEPPSTFWANLAFELLEKVHDKTPLFRDKLNNITPIITKIPKAEDKQSYIKDFIHELYDSMINNNKK